MRRSSQWPTAFSLWDDAISRGFVAGLRSATRRKLMMEPGREILVNSDGIPKLLPMACWKPTHWSLEVIFFLLTRCRWATSYLFFFWCSWSIGAGPLNGCFGLPCHWKNPSTHLCELTVWGKRATRDVATAGGISFRIPICLWQTWNWRLSNENLQRWWLKDGRWRGCSWGSVFWAFFLFEEVKELVFLSCWEGVMGRFCSSSRAKPSVQTSNPAKSLYWGLQ